MPRKNGLLTKWEKEDRPATPSEVANEVVDQMKKDGCKEINWSLFCMYFDRISSEFNFHEDSLSPAFSVARVIY